MEKVKLSQEQAGAIKEKLKTHNKNDILRMRANPFSKMGAHINAGNKIILDMEIEKLAKALFIGYEIDQEFEVGDWVVREQETNNDFIGKITRIKKGTNYGTVYSIDRLNLKTNEIRHATNDEIKQEKERRWWNKHNRSAWDLNRFDVLINKFDSKLHGRIVNETHNKLGVKFYGNNGYTGWKTIKRQYEIVSFVEDGKFFDD